MTDIVERLREIGEKVCEHCGVFEGDHDYEHLARECYPKQLAAKDVEIERLRHRLEIWRQNGGDILREARLDELEAEIGRLREKLRQALELTEGRDRLEAEIERLREMLGE